ncbi:MAG: outer membrane protein OmpA-like peptidoglycan-associated protein [Verrucomicrobiales bacterium]|jgi:outer membrane protein OmpA-like peptidoglycan-associated protein
MSENSPSDNDFNSLADRAKEMLDQVRDTIDSPDEENPAPSAEPEPELSRLSMLAGLAKDTLDSVADGSGISQGDLDAPRTSPRVPLAEQAPKPIEDASRSEELYGLFVEPKPTEPKSMLGWLLPLILLALVFLAVAFWLGDADPPANSESTASTATTEVSDPVATTESPDSSGAAASPTTSTAQIIDASEPSIPASAWELLGAESGTAQFAELGSSLGLQAALEQRLDTDGNPLEFTLFAPSDAAIDALPEAQLSELENDPSKAEALINYHLVDVRLTPELIAETAGNELISRSGLRILVEIEGDAVVLNGLSRISLAELEAANGNVLVIDAVLQPPTVDAILNIGNIQFEVISSIIAPAGEVELQKAVTYFEDNPDATALIEGHTDTDGEAAANLLLSERRAEAVRAFLISQGIDGARLQSQGFGETQPVLVDGLEDKNRSRRIKFTLG